MNPAVALSNPAFRFYVALLMGLVVVAGLLLAVLRFALRRNVDHAWRSYCGWLVMIPLLLLVIFLGRVTTIVFFVALGSWGLHEFSRATRLNCDRPMYAVVQCGIVLMGLVCLVPDPRLHVPGWYGLFMALPAYWVAVILLVPIVRNRVEGQLQSIALALVGFTYFGWMFGHLAFLANSRHAYAYLLYLLFAVELNDIAAFTCGKMFGRRPLRSQISPKKTWGGSCGALAVSLTIPWLMWWTMPHLRAGELVLAGLLVGVGGQLGDLSVSVIKRDIGIKDMGAAIPGHGGILDRIDSLIYVAPLFFHLMRWFHGLY